MKSNSKVVSTNDSGDGPKTNESQAKSSDNKKLVTKEKSSDALTAMRSDLQINRIFYLLILICNFPKSMIFVKKTLKKFK